MKLLVQRVKSAHVTVNDETIGQIDQGLLAFLGIHVDDTEGDIAWLVDKLVHLRIFEDDAGKMNHSVLDNGGSILLVSQFTLYGNCSQGRRPSFIEAASSEIAKPLYKKFVESLQAFPITIATGEFGAEMAVHLINDGPVTLQLEKKSLRA